MPFPGLSARLRWWSAALLAGLSLGVAAGTVLVGHQPAVLAPLDEDHEVCQSPLVRGGAHLAAAVETITDTPASLTARRCGPGLRVWDAPQRSAARDRWSEQTNNALGADTFAAAAILLAQQERQHRQGPLREAITNARSADVSLTEDHDLEVALRELHSIRGARTQALSLVGARELVVPPPRTFEVAGTGAIGAALAAAAMMVTERRWQQRRGSEPVPPREAPYRPAATQRGRS